MIVAAHQTMLAPPALPYDAEVEYLGCSGTQYIDTGIVPNINTGYDIRGEFAKAEAYARCGCRNNNNNTAFVFLSVQGTGFRVDWGTQQFSFAANYIASRVSLDKYRTFRIYDSSGTLQNSHTFSGAFNGGLPSFTLFAFHRQDDTLGLALSMKISEAILFDGDTTVFHGVPVRVGSGSSAVGYLYDRVSGTIFGNAGTGAFQIGPDK